MSRSTPAGPTSTSRPPSRIPSTRPGTAMTRPGTAMGGRASTIQGHDLGEWVCAVIQGQGESRGRLVHDTWELMRVIEAGGMDIGIASYCLTTGKVRIWMMAVFLVCSYECNPFIRRYSHRCVNILTLCCIDDRLQIPFFPRHSFQMLRVSIFGHAIQLVPPC